MNLSKWIIDHRDEIDAFILSVVPGNRLNDDERRLWVTNNESLYLWAKAEGVQV